MTGPRILASVTTIAGQVIDTDDLPKIVKREDYADGSFQLWLDSGAVWSVHPLTGPACLRESAGGAA